ncbi:unnamed protein product [Menidia menidia]|uniref:(Atlantic silverside) hypothetical protein n=1 Tax=Menidia menidia TaxID=238744 RepID=A0A8S4B8Z4_9TELE|nr:unnamed protein product [Menidia menidia]
MEITALGFLWLLSAFPLTTQELVRLKVKPTLSALCGKEVSLHCNTSSSQRGLLITHMEWSQDKTPLCSVNSEEKLTTYKRHSPSDFHCKYTDGSLSLVFKEVLPPESGISKPYRCKLHSNQGVPHEYTRVELQECCGPVESIVGSDGPSCTFNRVYPDGDVHWFHSFHNLSDGSVRHNTAKSVDKQGWVTIRSWLTIDDSLDWRNSVVPYNCSLKSTVSDRYIASTLVQKPEHDGGKGYKICSQGNINIFLSFLFFSLFH